MDQSPLRWDIREVRRPPYVIMAVADVLVRNGHQAISDHQYNTTIYL